ncbi:MAG: pirin family protein [Oligoflexia bacterium]|nr:pirin family protein [Oligoflexia bacterium]
MENLYKNESRGKVDIGWLKSAHSFSFGHYFDANRMGFGQLRVLNDDFIEAHSGFSTHGHQNMEIITIILSGEISHKDSEGNEGTIKEGEVQVMSAGAGIRHSEMNHSNNETVLFQIWIMPRENGTKPGYQQKDFKWMDAKGIHKIVTSDQDEHQDSLKIKQEATLTLYNLGENEEHVIKAKKGFGHFIISIDGELNVNNSKLSHRDAVEIVDSDITLSNKSEVKYLVIETIL